jgi:tetratricopeptide (TPR) repeat protein
MNTSGKLYARWLHSFDPYYETATEQGITRVFGTEHEWTESTPAEMRRQVEAFRRFRAAALALPVEVHVLTSEEVVHGRTGPEWTVAIRQAAYPLRDVLDVRGPADAEGHAAVTLRQDATAVSLAGVASVTLHSNIAREAGQEAARPYDALVAVGLTFDQVGHADLAARVLHAFAAQSTTVLVPDAALLVASTFAKARRVREALEVAQALTDRPEEDADTAAMIVGLAALHAAPHMNADERDEFDRFLLRRIERGESGRGDLGPAHYSFANHLRTSGRSRRAVRHYRLAAKFDPGYRERGYFWRELGSALFLERRYRWATEALQRAIDLGDDPKTQALHADALMFAGEFRSAEGEFAEYLKAHPPGQAEWRLKRHVLTTLRDSFGDSCARDPDKALALAGIAEDPRESSMRRSWLTRSAGSRGST